MTKSTLFCLPIVAILIVAPRVPHRGEAANEHIRISTKVQKDSLRAGDEGKLLFTITPEAGFHVNVEPALALKLSDPKRFVLLNKTFVPDSTANVTTTKDGFKIFNSGVQAVFGFRLAKSLRPGRYSFEAALTYYYCNDAEGWCSFATEAFPVAIAVVTSP